MTTNRSVGCKRFGPHWTLQKRRTCSRFRWVARSAGIVLFTATLVTSGCTPASVEITNVPITMKFENVRRVGSGDKQADEWTELAKVLAEKAVQREGKPALRVVDPDPNPTDASTSPKTLPGTDIYVRPVLAEFVVPRLRDVEAIHAQIIALRKRKTKGPIERVDFELLERSAQFRYKSNYIIASLRITLSGLTTPNASVTLLLLDGRSEEFTVGADGRWSREIVMYPNRKWVYGYSVEKESGVTKHFRLNVFTQTQELISKDEYLNLKDKEL
ncbi:MAG: hypothetical protein HY763_03725 [Planctomycetes bacterium]|nr:hypothetical protein [Planctomycetota bacterium]